jgi:hypothetical protein
MCLSRSMWVFLAALMALAVVACSSDDSGDDDGPGSSPSRNQRDGGGGSSSTDQRDGGDSSGSSGSGGRGSRPEDTRPVGNDLTLLFNPAYSAYDGVHTFKLPAIVQGVQDVEWSARPADSVDLTPDSSTGGVMITTRAAGDVQIIARAGALSGSLMLHITDATPEEWEIGEQRYNNEIAFPDPPDGGIMIPDGGFTADGGFTGGGGFNIPDNLSCRNCHGSTAEALDVEHTPQQTGGYSDDELIAIFTMGTKPERAKFHTPFPESIYMRYHTWEATEDEKKGIVIYLRSLEPKTQGALDFAGLRDAFGVPSPSAP